MQWQDVCERRELNDLPFKIELNVYGKIIMSPVKVIHSAMQGEIEFLLRSLLRGGKTLPECAIKTSQGTKVADVAWASIDVFNIIKGEVECSIAPEICVEVISVSNSEQEMIEKRVLYFEAGAKECWTCSETGVLGFYHMDGKVVNSILIPDFPKKIEW